MDVIQKIINLALSQIGYVEGKNNSNKYGEAYGWNNVAWCVQFLWWLFAQLGISDLFYGGNKTASCGELNNFHKAAGQAVSWDQLRPGDIMFMNFGSGVPEHAGLVIAVGNGSVNTMEGNTAAGSSGSQSNGGGVYKRTRYKSQFIAAYRPAYEGAVSVKPIGYSSDSFIRDIQRAIGAGVDGEVGPETKGKLPLIKVTENATHPAVAHIQVRLFALGYALPEYGADGDFGAETEAAVKKFQADRGIAADGEVGPDTFGELFKD